MAEQDKDKLADLLAAMSNGQPEEPAAEAASALPAPPPPAPAAPRRPAAPEAPKASRPLAPTARTRPATPAAAPAARPPVREPEPVAYAEAVDDAPGAAPPRATAGIAPSSPRGARQPVPLFLTLGFRQTIIPVLLTCGVLLPIVGSLGWLADEDSVLSRMPFWFPMLMWVMGLVMLGFGVLTMFQVRHGLGQRA